MRVFGHNRAISALKENFYPYGDVENQNYYFKRDGS